ncbi:MAG TPA: hypothetical protein VJM33_10075 [Microthrixaceae bacterium]|nr:hypothetical protein [Microthrixaceae bacterium]
MTRRRTQAVLAGMVMLGMAALQGCAGVSWSANGYTTTVCTTVLLVPVECHTWA